MPQNAHIKQKPCIFHTISCGWEVKQIDKLVFVASPVRNERTKALCVFSINAYEQSSIQSQRKQLEGDRYDIICPVVFVIFIVDIGLILPLSLCVQGVALLLLLLCCEILFVMKYLHITSSSYTV